MPTWTTNNTTCGTYYNQNIWDTWTGTGVTSSTVVPTCTNPEWYGSVYNNGIWQNWNTANKVQSVFLALAVSPEAMKRQEEDSKRRALCSANRLRSQRLRKKIAEKAAEGLLLSTLNEEQREEYMRLQRFHLIVGDRKYRIRKGMHGNIDVIEDNNIVERLCVYAQGGVPEQDNMLAQKLILETDEEHLRQTANITLMRRAA